MTSVLGYLPQELIGTSVYEYYHFVDINHLSEGHRKTLKTRDKVHTQPYRIKAKDGSFVKLKSSLHGFVNPWNKDVEYIICKNSLYRWVQLFSYWYAVNMVLASTYDFRSFKELEGFVKVLKYGKCMGFCTVYKLGMIIHNELKESMGLYKEFSLSSSS